jgi:hypothetical protein
MEQAPLQLKGPYEASQYHPSRFLVVQQPCQRGFATAVTEQPR